MGAVAAELAVAWAESVAAEAVAAEVDFRCGFR